MQVGKVPGVYNDWASAQAQIRDVKGPKYKKFGTWAEAEAFVAQGRQFNGDLVHMFEQVPPEKKRKMEMINRSAPGLVVGSIYAPRDADGNAYEPGTGPLPPGAEDGFDPNIKLDIDGQVVNKVEAEKVKTKIMTRERDPPGMLRIYTDGSSLRNGTAGARAGIGVFFGPQDPKYALSFPFSCRLHSLPKKSSSLESSKFTKADNPVYFTETSPKLSRARAKPTSALN